LNAYSCINESSFALLWVSPAKNVIKIINNNVNAGLIFFFCCVVGSNGQEIDKQRKGNNPSLVICWFSF